MGFRKDINGLRAIAVLAVVFFHFKIAGFSGGFSGVDVFFVISGYLMTAIIFTRIRKENFSIIDFYVSRARRIIPALATLSITLIILGNFYLESHDYRELLRDIKSSLFFTSNIYYSKEANYFATPPQENWLLHTWSLSVEWQFYIFYPIITALLCKFFKESTCKILLVSIAIISFIGANIYGHHNPTANFYLLPNRAWEMLAGGIVFLFPIALGNKTRIGLELTGLLLIVFGIIYFTEGDLWPSYLSLVPVVGTMMVLYGNRDSIITNNLAAQFIGKVSYSFYLWHWPTAVFLYYCGIMKVTLYVIIGMIVSFILAVLSYYFVEQFFLRKKDARYITLAKYLAVMIVLGGIITPSIASYVKKYRYPIEEAAQQQQANNPPTNERCTAVDKEIPDCEFGQGKENVIVIGDSHAQAVAPAIHSANPQKTVLWARGGCPILDTFRFKSSSETAICHKYTKRVFDRLASQHTNIPVIIINRASLYTDPADVGGHLVRFDNIHNDRQTYLQTYRKTYINTVCKIAKNHPVYIVKPIPEMRANIFKSLQMQKHFLSNLTDITLPIEQYNERQAFILSVMNQAEQECGAKLLDPTLYLCPNGKECLGSQAGIPLYSDDNHLNAQGSTLLVPLFKTIFEGN